MSCGCNGYCNNQECSNHIFTCGNSYAYTEAITAGVTVIDNLHMTELQAAVNGAYTRRGMGTPSWTGWPVSGGDTITAARFTVVKTNINALSAGLVTSVFTAGNIIYASQSNELRTDGDVVRNVCICNYNCTCNINCSCNVNCVCDYSDERVKTNIVSL